MTNESEEEKVERLKKLLPLGMAAATGPELDQDIATEILDRMVKMDFPWDSPPVVVLIHEHDGKLHPAALIPLMAQREKDHWEGIGISELGDYLPDVPPPDPIVALAFVGEIYIGSRPTEDPDQRIGDEDGDLEARISMVHFAGGGKARAIHMRESGITARWGDPNSTEDMGFRTTANGPQDSEVFADLAALMVRINNP